MPQSEQNKNIFTQELQKIGSFYKRKMQSGDVLGRSLAEEMGMTEDWFKETFNALKDSVADSKQLLRVIDQKIDKQAEAIKAIEIIQGQHKIRIMRNEKDINGVGSKVRWWHRLLAASIVTGVIGLAFWLIKQAVLH